MQILITLTNPSENTGAKHLFRFSQDGCIYQKQEYTETAILCEDIHFYDTETALLKLQYFKMLYPEATTKVFWAKHINDQWEVVES